MSTERKMRRFTLRLVVATVTFSLGVFAFTAWYFDRGNHVESQPSNVTKPVGEHRLAASVATNDPCSFRKPEGRKLTNEEAVQLAECFIVQNGYTNLPPAADKSKLTPESVFPGTDEAGMRMRHDSLERRAYGVVSNEKYGGGWAIVFRYRNKPDAVRFYGERLAKIGRAVTMDAQGGRMRVEHQDYSLSAFGKLGESEH